MTNRWSPSSRRNRRRQPRRGRNRGQSDGSNWILFAIAGAFALALLALLVLIALTYR